MAAYFRPSSLAEALAIRARRPVTVLAGGTDVYPARANRVGWGDMRRDDILDVSAIAELKGIAEDPDRFRFGALTTWDEMRQTALPPAFVCCQKAARDIGGAQVQNRGTLVGNICTASPAGDGIPCLLSLDAEVELASERGRRMVPIAQFIDGYRHTVCGPDELVTAILIPKPPTGARGNFIKLGARRYLVISIVMAAAVLATDDAGAIAHARIAVGACSAVAQRLPLLERALLGQPLAVASDLVEAGQFAALAPIDDVRGSGAFRAAAAADMVRDLLAGIVREPTKKSAVESMRGAGLLSSPPPCGQGGGVHMLSVLLLPPHPRRSDPPPYPSPRRGIPSEQVGRELRRAAGRVMLDSQPAQSRFSVNGEAVTVSADPFASLAGTLRDRRAHRHQDRLRRRRLRRLHGARRRRAGLRLPRRHRSGGRCGDPHGRRSGARRTDGPAARGIPRARGGAVRHLHAGHADGGRGLPVAQPGTDARARWKTRSAACCAAARATSRSWRR